MPCAAQGQGISVPIPIAPLARQAREPFSLWRGQIPSWVSRADWKRRMKSVWKRLFLLRRYTPLCRQCLRHTPMRKRKKEGIGRIGELPQAIPFRDFAKQLKERLGLDAIRLVGDGEKPIKRVGLCTGAGVEFVSLAAAKGCDAYLTADIKYHEAQKAVEQGIAVADVTHYASEVLIVPVLQEKLQAAAKENGWNIEVVCSEVDGQTFWTIE